MKNKELNLVELLKDIPEGTKFYSPICGEVKFVAINNSKYPITTRDSDGIKHLFTEKGYYINSGTPECLLFPSKDQRDWNNFQVSQIRIPKYRIGDYIIFKGNDNLTPLVYKILDIDNKFYEIIAINDPEEHTQSLSLFDPILENSIKVNQFDPKWLKPFDEVLCRNSDKDKWKAHFFSHIDDDAFYATFFYKYCIPYNFETKHLIGTNQDAPEFYINWEE